MKIFGKVIGGLLVLLFIITFLASSLQIGWNNFIVVVFGLPEITGLQALAGVAFGIFVKWLFGQEVELYGKD